MQNYRLKFRIKPIDRRRYLFVKPQDYEILFKIYRLEKHKLSGEDKKTIKFIRTQLMKDWRSPILKVLNDLIKKYK